ncbi:LytTR family DNA-binding domain-containing protein [Paenibacillus sp. GbtcB18]|uniref:LytR/AlgR family response regulator transcription factor n=1 Tax=Paenibacillus sp. GbtcB18 TaxID=2824763 RepID=UPI001C2F68F8|nr:LytTR family DNA-binding domain-containing protein [Paenibacillus sp. GbtcB18]
MEILKRDDFTLSVMIAEDDEATRNFLAEAAKSHNLDLLDAVSSGSRLVRSALETRPDLIIMDIGLERMDGISACTRLVEAGIHPCIIFVTGSIQPEHYGKSYELESVDYVTKPFTKARLDRALQRAKDKVHLERLSAREPKGDSRLVSVPHRNRLVHFAASELLYAEKVSRHCTRIVLTCGKVIESDTNLSRLAAQCPDIFLAPHRSYLLNGCHVKKVLPDPLLPGNYLVEMKDSAEPIPLSRKKYREFIAAFQAPPFYPAIIREYSG